jgi:hypothetical protein
LPEYHCRGTAAPATEHRAKDPAQRRNGTDTVATAAAAALAAVSAVTADATL